MQEHYSPGWLMEGQFISFLDDQQRSRYYFIRHRDWAHYEYYWPEDVATLTESGPHTLSNMEPTKYTEAHGPEQIYQFIFGFKPDVYLYILLPEDVYRHGLPKLVTGTATHRRVGHYRMQDSPYELPSWATEHFLVPRLQPWVAMKVFNPLSITLHHTINAPQLNIYINKMVIEHLGDELEGVLSPNGDRYAEILDKLHRRVVPHRPLTLKPVRAPATTT